jgi:glycine betaine/choline ABC-type transport system substrate-binding protein
MPTLARLAALGLALSLAALSSAAAPAVVGSKRFTESYILGEVVRRCW